MDIYTLKDFFGWMTLINLGLFAWTAIMCVWCRGLIYRVHGKMFGLTEETTNKASTTSSPSTKSYSSPLISFPGWHW